MKSKNLSLIVTVVLVVSAIVYLSGGFSGEQKPSPLVNSTQSEFEIGNVAPDFVLTDFEGNETKLSDFRGKAVMIDFWADWCPFCREEMPAINEVFNEFDGDLIVLGIHRTSTEKLEVGREFAQELGIDYVLLQDSTDEVYEIYGRGRGFMPLAVYLDRDGVVIDTKAGPKTAEEIQGKINEIINE